MGQSIYAMSGIWFWIGFSLAACVFNTKIRQSLFRLVQTFTGKAQGVFMHAVPETADKGLAAGWAVAGGAFVSLVLQNVGPFISASDPWLQVTALSCISIVVVSLTFYLYGVNKQQIIIGKPWPFVVWSHYRPLLTKVAAAVRPQGNLDFVTHQGDDLSEHLCVTGPAELRYGPCQVDKTIALICDVEAMEEVLKAPFIKDRAINIDLECLGVPDRFPIHESLAKKLRIDGNQPAHFMPMRWGFNALAIKCDDTNLANVLREKFLGPTFSGIDLFDFITNPGNEIRLLLQVNGADCPLITFEWFLPPMMLLVSAASGGGAWTRQNAVEEKRILDLINATEAWLHKTADNQEAVKPIIKNVVEMQDILVSQSLCVVLAGGNFLWSQNQDSERKGLSPDNLVCIPVNFMSKDAPSCLLWCEVLAIYSTADQRNDIKWRREAKSLLKEVNSRMASSMNSVPFHGYSPYPSQQANPCSIYDQWCDFALEKGVVRYGDASIHHWRNKWADLCDRVQSRVSLPGGDGGCST